MRILLIDNFDSFTYNLKHYLEHDASIQVEVVRNDDLTIADALNYDRIVISPGPGLPNQAGISLEVIQKLSGRIPILGVCLGMQAIMECFGGSLTQLKSFYHGEATELQVLNRKARLFKNLPECFQVGRYHSWALDTTTLPKVLSIDAVDVQSQIPMAISHEKYPLWGVQFHPESVMSPYGKMLLKNFTEVNW
ncbi:MAG: aminodeoxychorismate/anthranilate synthase component II [Flavobacteriaceae bacterium]|nr:aminodeoxychorismate/anthranilate synthase component II [Flavobacteriaceae bacterium]